MIPAIYSFSKKVRGQEINFVRIDQLCGWWAKVNNNFYGNYITMAKDEKIDEKFCNEVFAILEQQTERTLKFHKPLKENFF